MTVCDNLRPIDLARSAGLSVQQVRNYEARGLIPPAARSPRGYRLYTRKHIVALEIARGLAGGYGWRGAREIMQAIHRGDLPAALALIDERHADLALARRQIGQTLAALGTLAAPSTPHATPLPARSLRVGEAARLVGRRVSALRFWEQQGILHPKRDARSGYRLYDERQVRRLHVVALLREAGYDFSTIRTALAELTAGRPERAMAAVEKRRSELDRTSRACLAGLAALHRYLGEYWPEAYTRL